MGSGVMFVKKDGSVRQFCSSKCRKNELHLGREGRLQKWTRAGRIFKGKEKQTLKEKSAAGKSRSQKT